MDRLDEISVEELQHALGYVEGKKPTQRLLAAVMYKHDVTQTERAERYARSSDERSIAGSSDSAPSRSSTQSKILIDLGDRESPLETNKTNSNARSTSSRPKSRLMNEAESRYQNSRRRAAEADPDERGEFREEKKDGSGRHGGGIDRT